MPREVGAHIAQLHAAAIGTCVPNRLVHHMFMNMLQMCISRHAGGSPAQCELLASYIRSLAQETSTPVYAFAQDVAASGGYWLMCAGAHAFL